MRARRLRPAVLALALLASALAVRAESRVFKVDPSRSGVLIRVGKAGLLSFAGHEHEVAARKLRGEVRFDPSGPAESRVWIEIEAASLEVTGAGEPAEDVPEVQATMRAEQVLDVERYPTIRFESSGVEVGERREGALDLTVAGSLTLHGVTRSIRVPLTVEIESASVLARGSMTIRLSEFGIRPPSAVGGTVKVKDVLRIELALAATAN